MPINNHVKNYRLQKLPQNAIAILIKEIESNLVFATVLLIVAMTLVFASATLPVLGNDNPEMAIAIAFVAALIVYFNAFLFAPWLIDLSQQWLYQTRWISLTEFASLSPETAKAIKQVCSTKSCKQLRIGIIDDNHPTAFIYGSLSRGARLVISRGLFELSIRNEKPVAVYMRQLTHSVAH